jgi:RNA polymerase sigma factor (sigma-70 family)
MELAPPAPMILMLRFQHGFSLREIAEMLDMNYNTVKTITFRAVQQLKTRLQNIC